MKNNNNKMVTKSRKSNTMKQHVFRGIREVVCIDAAASAALNMTLAPGATSSVAFVTFSPLGLSTPALTVSGSNVIVASPQPIVAPSMRWLFNTAQNFGKYRVTRATVSFVGNVGTTTSGQLVVTAFKDVFDANITTQVAYATGSNARVFDLAASGSKELKIPIPVDSSWKKVSKVLAVNGNTTPFLGFTNQLVNVNTANDLAFGAMTAQVVGAPANSGTSNTIIGTFFIDYDVEFGEPESSSLNL